MITITLKELIRINTSISNVMSLPLPAREAYRLAVAAKKIKQRYEAYDQVRHSLFAKYGEKVEDKNEMRIRPENVEVFTKELEGLLSEVVEIDMEPLSVSILGDTKVSATDLENMSAFFTG